MTTFAIPQPTASPVPIDPASLRAGLPALALIPPGAAAAGTFYGTSPGTPIGTSLGTSGTPAALAAGGSYSAGSAATAAPGSATGSLADSVRLSQQARVRLFNAQGETPTQIAVRLGVPVSDVDGDLYIAPPASASPGTGAALPITSAGPVSPAATADAAAARPVPAPPALVTSGYGSGSVAASSFGIAFGTVSGTYAAGAGSLGATLLAFTPSSLTQSSSIGGGVYA